MKEISWGVFSVEISCFLGKAVAFGLNQAGWFSFLLCNAAFLLRVVPWKAEQGDLGFIKKQNTTKQKNHQSFAERNLRGKGQRSWKNIIILICVMFLIAKLALPQSGQLLMRYNWTLKAIVPAILPQGSPVTVNLSSNLLQLRETGFSYWRCFIRTVFVTIKDLQFMVLRSDFREELKFRDIKILKKISSSK